MRWEGRKKRESAYMSSFLFWAASPAVATVSCMVLPDSSFLVIPTLLDCAGSQDNAFSYLCSSIHECNRDFLLLLIPVAPLSPVWPFSSPYTFTTSFL